MRTPTPSDPAVDLRGPPRGSGPGPQRAASPVDVVFTWVDGADPAWRAAFRQWVALETSVMGTDARDEARYRDNDELRYAMRSLEQYAPWVRTIHVVTAGHAPRWLDVGHPRIHLVAHDEIFDPEDLPTFNSHAIEARLHHTPGLAERFIYCNDDVCFARPQAVTDYFDDEGRPLVSMTAKVVPPFVDATSASCNHAALNGLQLLGRDLGVLAPGRPSHGPFALRRSFLAELEARFAPELAATSAQRFRSSSDVSLPTFLAPMHALSTGRGGISAAVVAEINVDDADLAARLATLGDDTSFDSFCLNDTERVVPGPDGPRALATTFLRARFAAPASWELDAADQSPDSTAAMARGSSSASSLAR